jgi:two-component system cell cycle response regulator
MGKEATAKVLIVDDEPIMVNLMIAALSEEGYQVATAVNGALALAQVEAFKPDVVLLDVVMPELNGFQVTERLKADPATAGIPIILVTGLGSIEDRVKGLEAGADDFLSKPFNLDELLVRVRSLARLKELQDKLAKKEAECPEGRRRQPRRRQPLLLVVEDDKRIVRICENVLSAGGYQIIGAGDAEAAIRFMAQETPDLIILDLMLPGMDGLEFLAKLKGEPSHSDVPVIILSALGDLKTKVKGLQMGADDYIVKPVSSLELLARVKANLRKRDIVRRLQSAEA